MELFNRNNNNRNINSSQQLKDYGPYPFAINIEQVTQSNNAFGTTLWTGPHMQLTLMSFLPGEDIGLERHPNVDQFIRIKEGKGMLMMGKDKDAPTLQQAMSDGYVFIVPASTWHNLTNIGQTPLELYSIYAPPKHPFGSVHQTKAIAEEEHPTK